MTIAIWVAVIGALATLLAAVGAQFLSRRREIKLAELKFKLDRYMDFLAAFSEIGSGYKTYEAHLKLANAVNTMNLIASKAVLDRTYRLLDYVDTRSGSDYSVKEQDELIRRIVLAIREDLQQDVTELQHFSFRTISPGIRPGDVVES